MSVVVNVASRKLIELAWYGGGGAMQAGGGWFVPWTMGVQKFAVALPMGGVVPLVPPLLAALPPAPPPLRLIAPPMQHQSQSGRKVSWLEKDLSQATI